MMTVDNATGHNLFCAAGCGVAIGQGEMVTGIVDGQRVAFHWVCWSDWDTACGLRSKGYPNTVAQVRADRLARGWPHGCRGPKEPRTIENDLRLLFNYCARVRSVAERVTPEEIAALSDYDLYMMRQWTGPVGGNLHAAAIGGLTREEAHANAVSNVGYTARYADDATYERIIRYTGARHPIFG